MTKTRAALFEEDDIDLSDFKAEAKSDGHFPPKNEVKTVSEQSGFSSREPNDQSSSAPEADEVTKELTSTKRKPYNSSDAQKVQLNIRVSQDVADAFYRIARDNEWSLGQTLRKSIESLERKLKNG